MESENTVTQLRQILATNFLRQTSPKSNCSPKVSKLENSRFMKAMTPKQEDKRPLLQTPKNKCGHVEDLKGEVTLSSTIREDELSINNTCGKKLNKINEECSSNYNTTEHITLTNNVDKDINAEGIEDYMENKIENEVKDKDNSVQVLEELNNAKDSVMNKEDIEYILQDKVKEEVSENKEEKLEEVINNAKALLDVLKGQNETESNINKTLVSTEGVNQADIEENNKETTIDNIQQESIVEIIDEAKQEIDTEYEINNNAVNRKEEITTNEQQLNEPLDVIEDIKTKDEKIETAQLEQEKVEQEIPVYELNNGSSVMENNNTVVLNVVKNEEVLQTNPKNLKVNLKKTNKKPSESVVHKKVNKQKLMKKEKPKHKKTQEKNSRNVWEYLYSLDRGFRARRERCYKEKKTHDEKESLRQCTFHPEINLNDWGLDVTYKKEGSFYDRSVQWLQTVEERYN